LRRLARLSETEGAWLERVDADGRAIFNAPSTTRRGRKQMLRAIVAEIVCSSGQPTARRKSPSSRMAGAKTSFTHELDKTGGHFRCTDEASVAT
jgi:hypothetical protein